MTVNGTIHRAGLLLLCVVTSALWAWSKFGSTQDPRSLLLAAVACVFGAVALVWVTVFKMKWSPITGPAYALMEGFVLGIISAGVEARYPGTAIEAVGLTFAVLFLLLFAYRVRIIRVTDSFATAVVAATFALAVFYPASFALSILFGVRRHSVLAGGVPGTIVSALVVLIAALNLLVDFKFIEICGESGLPKYMEWFAALGLIVTLVWLYTEILDRLFKAKRGSQAGS